MSETAAQTEARCYREERLEWLRERQSGLGGTDLASISGVGFREASEIYQEKVSPEPVNNPGSAIMRMGLATEVLNAELYAEKYSSDVTSLYSPGLMRSKSDPWHIATFDRIAVAVDSHDRAVDLKYAGPFFGDKWGDDGTDQVPEGYVIQATWQTAIAVANGATMLAPHISALSGSGEHRVYVIPFSRRLADLLLELGAEFWRRVVKRQEVGPEWNHPLREKISQQLAIVQPGSWIRLGPEADILAEEYDRLHFIKKQGEDAEEQIKVLKLKLRACLGENEEGQLADGRRVKQYPIAGVQVTPKPHWRNPRVDIRVLGKRR